MSSKEPEKKESKAEASSIPEPALEEPDALEIIEKRQGAATTPAVTTERKEQLLLQARNDRRNWLFQVPLPYKKARDPNNIWSLDDRLYPVQSSLASQRLPTSTQVLSELYGLESNTHSPQEIAHRVATVVQPLLHPSTPDAAISTGIVESDILQIAKNEGDPFVLAYHSFWNTLLKPECALLVQGMRNFLGSMEEVTSLDRLATSFKTYVQSTSESLKSHTAFETQLKEALDNESAMLEFRRCMESVLYGHAQPILEGLEWSGLFTSTEEEWTERIGRLQFVTPDHLEIQCLSGFNGSDGDGSLEELLEEPIAALASVDQYFSPYEKLQRILAVYKGVNAALTNALNSENSGQERKLPSADDVLPTIILTVLKAKPVHMFQNLQFVELFSPPEYLRGEAGYAYTNLYGAVQFLHDLNMEDPDSLSISPEDFRKGLDECTTKVQERVSIAQDLAASADQGSSLSTEIQVKDVREARLRGEVVDLEWAVQHQKDHPEKYGIGRECGLYDLEAPLPEGFKRSYGFMTSTPNDIRLADLPDLLAEYKMLVHVTEQLLGERGTRMALQKKKTQSERSKQLDDSFFGIDTTSDHHTMDDLLGLIVQRNTVETLPFIVIHESNARLLQQVDALQSRCNELERDLIIHRDVSSLASEGRIASIAESSSLKTETRLREKLEKVQEELHQKMQQQSEEQASALALAKELATNKDELKTHEGTISVLQQEIQKKDRAIEHLNIELDDAKSRTKLAEQQYAGLKDTIRILQEENDTYRKENMNLESRVMMEKDKMTTEVNKLSEMCEGLKREVDLLRSLQRQEDSRKSSWFGLVSSKGSSGTSTAGNTVAGEPDGSRKFDPAVKVVLPSSPRQKITAHTSEASCLKYDRSGADLLATGSADSTVKVWDTATGALRSTLRGGGSNAILACDINNGVVVGGGSDKTCRVWNLRTQRMVHHLVGHAHKVTCVRLFGGEKGVVTGSADRSLKVWDISRQTYRQTTTFRHSSTANCIDVGIDSCAAVTAHLDGGIRFWDMRTGERTSDLSNLHEGAVTSVQFHPTDSTKVLTNGLDSCVKIVDTRTCTPMQVLQNPEFHTNYGWSSAAFSPDGKYVSAGSNTNGFVFVWDSESGEMKCKLAGHESCVCGVAWGTGGTSGQQVSSVDKKGTLILWA
eukprot:Nitzschia sp. Nitz4//scaffold3_size479765//343825//348135//NITZ4_000144-RA/size479765-processed-gene-1.535-mRNA-1//-1//CDS//3329550890//3817//frame0